MKKSEQTNLIINLVKGQQKEETPIDKVKIDTNYFQIIKIVKNFNKKIKKISISNKKVRKVKKRKKIKK